MNCNCNCNCCPPCDNNKNNGSVRPIVNGCEPIACPPAKCFCCTGMNVPKFNSSAAHSIFANVQQIFDSETVAGCNISQPINLTPTGCSIITEFTPCSGGCCVSDPVIDENSCFVIQSYSATILNAYPTTAPTASDILINNIPFGGPVNVINQNKFSIALEDLSESVFNPLCQEKKEGSKVAVVLDPQGTTISFIAEYILCGTVTTSRGAFRFKMLIRNAEYETTTHTTSIFTNDVCLPFLRCKDTGLMTFDFCFDAQLIAPQIFVDANGQLTLTGTLIIIPTTTIETLIDKKVILSVIDADDAEKGDIDCNCTHKCK